MLYNRKKSILPFENIEEKSLLNPKRVYWLVKNPKTSKWAVLLHQYGGRSDFMVKQGKIYHEKYNLLFIDARSHGISQFCRESNSAIYAQDLLEILRIEGIKEVFLHGVSFGGIAILLAVKSMPIEFTIHGIIVEAICKDVKNIYKHTLEYSPIPYHLYIWFPAFMRYRRRKNFDWEGNSLDLILTTLTCPIFIIHGGHDRLYKPKIHFEANKKAVSGNKNAETWLAPGMEHSHMNEHPEWEKRVKSFVEKYTN